MKKYIVAIESKKQAARRPRPPFPNAASISYDNVNLKKLSERIKKNNKKEK